MSQQVDRDAYTTPFLLTKTGHRDPYPALSPTNPENSQQGKIAIITGGGSGIGAAAAKVWARAGASGIVIAGRRLDKLEELAKELSTINADTIILPIQTDITVEKDVENLYIQVQRKFGRRADVVINVAGWMAESKTIGDQGVVEWWKGFEINIKGLYTMVHHYIKSQADPSDPVGTIISVSTGLAGVTQPTGSSYSISKLGEQRLGEFVDAEYPKLRMFTTMPGIVSTDMPPAAFRPYAHDHVDLIGMLSLYLAQPRADYLKGSMVSVNWDVMEMEAQKEKIKEKNLLKTSWLPVLPVGGGAGLHGN